MVNTQPSEFIKFCSYLPKDKKVIYIPIQENNKRPDVAKGESWKDPKYHLTQEQALARLCQGNNVGVVANDWLCIFDLDNPDKYTFPKQTLTIKTRNGRLHKYFINDGSVTNSVGKNKLTECGEVRADWQYVVSAGSYIPADNEKGDGIYKVLFDHELATLSAIEIPEDFISTSHQPVISNPEIFTVEYRETNKYGWTIDEIRQRDQKLDELLAGGLAGHSSQSEADMAILTKLLFWGFSEGESVALVRKFCDRPKLQREDYITSTLGNITRVPDIGERVNVNKWHPLTGYGFKVIYGDKVDYLKKPEQDDNDKINRVQIAEQIQETHNFAYDQKAQTLYVYDSTQGIYTIYSDDVILEATRNILLEQFDSSHLTTITDTIKADSPKVEMNKLNPELLAVKNGILNVLTKELTPFTPEIYITNKLDVEYKPEVIPNNFKTFLTQVLPDPKQQHQLQQLLGHILYKRVLTETALILHGSGQNGKSILLQVITILLGAENITAYTMQDICSDPFIRYELKDKLANIFSDLPEKALENTGIMKAIISGDVIEGKKKHIQKTIPVQPFLKFIYSTNALPIPESNEESRAWFRRFFILDFKQVFEDNKAKPREQLINEMTTPQELTGILNWLLEGLIYLHANPTEIGNTDVKLLRKNYRQHSSTVLSFIDTQIIVTNDDEDFIEKDDLFKAYLKHCADLEKGAKSKKEFYSDIEKYCPQADFGRNQKLEYRPYGYIYIRVCNWCSLWTQPNNKFTCKDCPHLKQKSSTEPTEPKLLELLTPKKQSVYTFSNSGANTCENLGSVGSPVEIEVDKCKETKTESPPQPVESNPVVRKMDVYKHDEHMAGKRKCGKCLNYQSKHCYGVDIESDYSETSNMACSSFAAKVWIVQPVYSQEICTATSTRVCDLPVSFILTDPKKYKHKVCLDCLRMMQEKLPSHDFKMDNGG